MTTAICEERHKNINMLIRFILAGLISSFIAIGSLYLYASEKYALKDDIQLLRSEIQSGFQRIEKKLP
jgi:hypothetical protein